MDVLQNAAKVIRPGRAFVRRMIDLLKGPRRPYYISFVSTNSSAQIFIGGKHWQKHGTEWHCSLQHLCQQLSLLWGVGLRSLVRQTLVAVGVATRADEGIAFKELFAAIVSAAMWGKTWRGQQVRAHCDNEAAVHVMASRSSKNPGLMPLLRCMFFI